MFCLSCFQQITAENRQQYKGNLRMPYCRNCIQTYLAKRSLNNLSKDRRKEFINQSRKQLEEKQPYTKEQITESETYLRNIGLKEEEISGLLHGLQTR